MQASSAGRQDDPGQAARRQHLAGLLTQVARGDHSAFEQSLASGPVDGDDVAELVESALDQQRVKTRIRDGLIRMRALPRPVSAAAMTAVAAAIVLLGIVQAGTRHRLEQAQSANRAVAAVLTARRQDRD